MSETGIFSVEIENAPANVESLRPHSLSAGTSIAPVNLSRGVPLPLPAPYSEVDEDRSNRHCSHVCGLMSINDNNTAIVDRMSACAVLRQNSESCYRPAESGDDRNAARALR